MESHKLDAIDCRILEVLQRDGRISNVDLAAEIQLSAPQCFRRVRALEERGVIQGYRAQVRPEALGLSVTAFVSLSIAASAPPKLALLEQQLRDLPEVLELHRVSGGSDYLAKVVAQDLRALGSLLTERLLQIEGVGDVQSAIALNTLKATAALPVPR
ncbi:MAG: Lrp/AsnC family transcriptional regulator [Burkholderiales bacterium]|uniref:Lrp/AsnC family transcriptional regulator n=1 Tax=Inhella sp. TaxID=1921806 RepID=UPI001AC6DEB0|nr:Lrp/AsnC family transcriptional regulator [Burkholderiales bacterium]